MPDEEDKLELPGDATREAMKRLLSNNYDKIQWGIYYAVRIAIQKLTVHSREVRETMFKEGLIGEGKEHWLGFVFNELSTEGILIFTGQWYKYSDRTRRIHERTVKIWKLNEKADLSKYRERPPL